MKIKRISGWVISAVQAALFLAAAAVHYLSDKKMGMMRSLVYRNKMYSGSHLENMILIGLCITLIVLLVCVYGRRKAKRSMAEALVFTLLNIAAIAFLMLTNPDVMLTYYVWIIAVLPIMALEAIQLLIL